MRPMAAPAAKTRSTVNWNSLTADRMYLYIPSSTRIKLPEIPGRIMAQMAMTAETKTNQ